MAEEERLHAKGLLLRARLYRMCAVLFSLSGVGMFIMMFLNSSGGQISVIIKDPILIVVIVFPFIPAMILNSLARKAEKNFTVALEAWKSAAGKTDSPQQK